MPLSTTLAVLGVLAVVLLGLLLHLRHERHRNGQEAIALDDLAPMVPAAPAPSAPAPARPPAAAVPDVHQVACWTGLSRDLASEGRPERAALAQWAADLHVLAPHLSGRQAELAERLARLPADTPAATLARAREIALSLVADATGSVTAMLVPADHVATPQRRTGPGARPGLRRKAVPGDRAASLALAEHWTSRAATAAALGELGLEAREAELARFDALLVGLGERHGDADDHVTVLLGELARTVVRALPDPETNSASTHDARLVRQTLRQLLPPHVRPRLDLDQDPDLLVVNGR
ncbi:hypothetical protein [Nocardioides sp.]|uniref:hypothetical protein n=1 Tax=Nocardioides sp. TaxID=35761 RepID=UPI00286CF070|nr:hypothetical protein [Nocardioides sp.]